MGTASALAASIYDRPDDEIRWGVFADWLEENGWPDAAEVMRDPARRPKVPAVRHFYAHVRLLDGIHRFEPITPEDAARLRKLLPVAGFKGDIGPTPVVYHSLPYGRRIRASADGPDLWGFPFRTLPEYLAELQTEADRQAMTPERLLAEQPELIADCARRGKAYTPALVKIATKHTVAAALRMAKESA